MALKGINAHPKLRRLTLTCVSVLNNRNLLTEILFRLVALNYIHSEFATGGPSDA